MSPADCFAAVYYVFDKGIELMLPDMKITELGLVCVEERENNTDFSTASSEFSGLPAIPMQHLDCVPVWNCTFLVGDIISK